MNRIKLPKKSLMLISTKKPSASADRMKLRKRPRSRGRCESKQSLHVWQMCCQLEAGPEAMDDPKDLLKLDAKVAEEYK